jgi:hypothetical protein
MADTGEDREIKQRVSAHQEEVIRESKQRAEKAKPNLTKKKMPGRETARPQTKAGR